MDIPGKDSWRHKQAGAVTSLLVGSDRLMMVSDVANEALNPQLLANRYFPDVDLLLVEGYAGMEGSKIEVVRSARSVEMLYPSDKSLIAVVTDVSGLNSLLPQLGPDDVPLLARFVQNWMQR